MLPPVIFPTVLTLPPTILPLTLNDVRVPTEVILACAAVANDPVKFVPDMLPPAMLPVTFNEVRVPTEVILACALVVTVPAVVADVADVAVPELAA